MTCPRCHKQMKLTKEGWQCFHCGWEKEVKHEVCWI